MANYYGTVSGADAYFDDRLFAEWWFEATVRDREKALIMSARAIDRLNYGGAKNDAAQDLQFPRGNDTAVPVEIEYAAYECALKFISGVDIDEEIRALGFSGVSIAGARGTVNPNYVPEHLRAGIPSSEAWIYLQPYLRNPDTFSTSRV